MKTMMYNPTTKSMEYWLHNHMATNNIWCVTKKCGDRWLSVGELNGVTIEIYGYTATESRKSWENICKTMMK